MILGRSQPAEPGVLWRSAQAGGCARKAPMDVLAELWPISVEDGHRYMEDAARLEGPGLDLLQTIDVITPPVPDADDFGRIAAANAISDIFVSGGRPVAALAIACVPPDTEAIAEFREAMRAARDLLLDSGCKLVGGHTMIDVEAKLGFAVTGVLVLPGVNLASGARVGDLLILTKPLGLGLFISARKQGMITDEALSPAIEWMVRPNDCVRRLLEGPLRGAIHAATDVTGFGLVGHVSELCIRSDVGAVLDFNRLPILAGALALAEAGIANALTESNDRRGRSICDFGASDVGEAMWRVATDAQTSGGAVLAVDRSDAPLVVNILTKAGHEAAIVGEVRSEPHIGLRSFSERDGT